MLPPETHRMGRCIRRGVQCVRPKHLRRCETDTRHNWIQGYMSISSNSSGKQKRPGERSKSSSWRWTRSFFTIQMPILWSLCRWELCGCQSSIPILNARGKGCAAVEDITSAKEGWTESFQNDWNGFWQRRQRIFRQKEKAFVVDINTVNLYVLE